MKHNLLVLGLLLLLAHCGEQTVSVQTEYDLLERLDSAHKVLIANVTPEEWINPAKNLIADVPQRCIFQHAPSQLIYKDVFIGMDAALDFSIAVQQEAWKNNGDGVLFLIHAGLPNGVTETIFSKYIDPKKNEEERLWIKHRLSLSQIKNVTVNIVLETKSGETDEMNDSDSDWALWGSPRLISSGYKEKHVSPKKPNVLLITLDTVRADYIHSYGADWVSTPSMDRLADKGVLFERALTPISTTLPAHASILTSLYSNLHGAISNNYHLAEAIPRLPQIFQEMGYKTGAAVSVIHLHGLYSGLGKWFDFYDDLPYPQGNIDLDLATRSGYTTTSAAIRWMDQVHNDSFFLWVHYYDPHAPYQAEGEFHKMYYEGDPTSRTHTSMRNYIQHVLSPVDSDIWLRSYTDLEYFKKEYAAEISFVDSQIERLLDALKRLKVDENTLIVITADHGENIGDHEIYFDHWTMFESDIHVPLIFSYPKSLPKGKRVAEKVSLLDVAPTILDILGERDYDLASSFQGESLKPLWEGKISDYPKIGGAEGLLYTQLTSWNQRYKLIWDLREKYYHERLQLYPDSVTIYDLYQDPNETNPVGQFYWRDPDSIPVDWNKEIVLAITNEEKAINKTLAHTKKRIATKVVPNIDELKSWFLEENDRDFLVPELLHDDQFMEQLVLLMGFLKERADPPTLKEFMESNSANWVMSGTEYLDLASHSVNDPAMQDALKSLGYTH